MGAELEMIDAFLDDIVSHPEDPTLWLILSDWLEDHGDPRSELVRLSWSLWNEPNHAEFAVRQNRVQSLLAGGMVPVVPRRTFGEIEFAYIPPGSFLMGSPETEAERRNNEKQHRVTIAKGFYMGVYPVTQAQWQAVMGTNPSEFSRTGREKGIADAELARFPVENVSWDDAQEFCEKLSQMLGERVHLPSEAQWEYACRSGTTTPYHFGSILNGTQANCNGNDPYGTSEKGPYLGRPTPVGQPCYPSNTCGLFDVHGNVWEWCQDAYRDDYEELPSDDPIFVEQNSSSRVVRGGSWYIYSSICRAAYRSSIAPGVRDYYNGFRCVLLLP